MDIKIKKITKQAKTPTKGSKDSAGYDLYSAVDIIIQPQSWKLIKTNIALAIPEGFYGHIAPRSGLALKSGIEIMGGIIDSDYRGDVGVILFNKNNKVFAVRNGDRIAQIIIQKHYTVDWLQTEVLEESLRAVKGFGSTGV